MIRNIKKFDIFHSQLEEHTYKIKLILQSYVKQQYNINIIDFESSISPSLSAKKAICLSLGISL